MFCERFTHASKPERVCAVHQPQSRCGSGGWHGRGQYAGSNGGERQGLPERLRALHHNAAAAGVQAGAVRVLSGDLQASSVSRRKATVLDGESERVREGERERGREGEKERGGGRGEILY